MRMKIPQQARKPQNMSHWILGSVLLLVAAFLIVAIAYVNTHASIVSQVTVSNAPPTIGVIHVNQVNNSSSSDATSLAISPGATTATFINGTASDANGYADIVSINAELYSKWTGAGFSTPTDCPNTPNPYNCYPVSCTIGTHTDATTVPFHCDISLAYYARATDSGPHEDPTVDTGSTEGWIAQVAVTDSSNPEVDSNPVYTEVAAQGALAFPTAVTFATSLNPGDSTTTSTDFDGTATQNGNTIENMQLFGTAMDCTTPGPGVGTIPRTNQVYSLNSTDVGYSDGSNVIIPASATTVNIGVAEQTSSSATTKPIWFNLLVPATGTLGTCSGTLTMTSHA